MFHWWWIKPVPCLEAHQQGPRLRLEQVVQMGLPLHLPSLTPPPMRLLTKSLGPGWSSCPEAASCLHEASVGPLLFLPASQVVFWSHVLDAVTKVRLGQSLCEVGIFSLYYKVRLAVKRPLSKHPTAHSSPPAPRSWTCSQAHRLKANPALARPLPHRIGPGLHPW